MTLIFRKKEGQTIIEMIVALGVITTGLLGVISLLSNSLGLSQVVSNNHRATYLAAEGIEIIKSLVISNDQFATRRDWDCGLPEGTYEVDYTVRATVAMPINCALPDYGLRLLATGGSSTNPLVFHIDTYLYDYQNNAGSKVTPFYRTIKISYRPVLSNPRDMMIVRSVVHWRDKFGISDVNLINYFYNPSPTIPAIPPP